MDEAIKICNQAFDGAIKLCKLLDMRQAIIEKQAQIKAVNKKECGNCEHFMKSECPEKQDGVRRTWSSPYCEKFALSYCSKILNESFIKELKDLDCESHD